MWRSLSLVTMLLLLAIRPAAAEDLFQERSLYRNILVYEDQGLRCMKFGIHDSGRQTCISLRDPDALVFNYTKMLLGALYLNPSPKQILVIGLGGGTMPTRLKKILPDAQIDCVEIDPSVVKVATRFFGFTTGAGVGVNVEDGRVFVKRAQRNTKKYDLIILDAFDHVYIPEHMLTREYLMEVKALLAKNGVLAANTFSSSRLYYSESATYAEVYGAFYNLKMNNRVVLAKRDGIPSIDEIQRNAAKVEEKLRLFGTGSEWLLPLFSTDVQWPANTRILTDQYSPANLLNGRL